MEITAMMVFRWTVFSDSTGAGVCDIVNKWLSNVPESSSAQSSLRTGAAAMGK
jgi:hypothetical protein